MKKSFLLFICLWMAFGTSIYGQVKKIDTTMKLGNIGFKLVCSNKNEDKNFVTVSPIGFGSGARDVSFEVKGRIRKAEVDDLNNDFYPDMVMYVYTNDPNDKGTVVGISSIKNETLAGIGFPDIVDDPKLRTGYKGFDTFMLMEGSEHAFVVNIPGFAGFAATVFFTEVYKSSKPSISLIPTQLTTL